MAARRSKTWWRLAWLLPAAPMMIGAADLGVGFEGRLLIAHNRERATAQVGPLRWDANLARSAQGWADHLAATGRFEHAPERRVDPQGENLWAGSRGWYTLEKMVDAWVREKRYFKRGRFPNNSTTGRSADIGHYTQLMWRSSGAVGCAKASGAAEDVLVCRYSDAGNYIGEVPF